MKTIHAWLSEVLHFHTGKANILCHALGSLLYGYAAWKQQFGLMCASLLVIESGHFYNYWQGFIPYAGVWHETKRLTIATTLGVLGYIIFSFFL